MNRLFKRDTTKKCAISRTAERDCERQVKKLDQLEENCKQIYKDMKRCSDAQTALGRAGVKLSAEMRDSPVCREDDDLRQHVEEWHECNVNIDKDLQELVSTYQKTLIEPMKKYAGVFPHVAAAVKRRDQSLDTYSRCQAKLDKCQERERTGANVVKLDTSKKALAAAREDYEAQNAALMEDMPRMYESRLDYFHPSFQTLVESQACQLAASHGQYQRLADTVRSQCGHVDDQPGDTRHQHGAALEALNSNIEHRLDKIRALEITIDG